MVRQLEEVKKKLETSGRSWYSYSTYGGYSGWEDAKPVVSELKDKYQVFALKLDEKSDRKVYRYSHNRH